MGSPRPRLPHRASQGAPLARGRGWKGRAQLWPGHRWPQGSPLFSPRVRPKQGFCSLFFLHLLSWQRQGLTNSSFFPVGSVFTNQRQELPLLLLSQPQNTVEPEHFPAHGQEWREDGAVGPFRGCCCLSCWNRAFCPFSCRAVPG